MNPFKQIASFIKPYRFYFFSALLLMVIIVFVDLLIPTQIQKIIDQGISQKDLSKIYQTSLIMIGLSLLSLIFSVLNSFFAVKTSLNFAADLRKAVYQKIQSFSFFELDKNRTGDLITRLTSDIANLQQIVLMTSRILTRAPLMLIGSIFFLIRTSPQLSLILLAIIPTVIILILFFFKKGQPIFTKVQQKTSRLNNIMQENLAGIRIVKAFVQGNTEINKFQKANSALQKNSTQVFQMFSILIPVMFLIINFATIAVLYLGGIQSINGSLTLGQIIAFSNYLLSTLFPMVMLSMFIAQSAQAFASARRITKILNTENNIKDIQSDRQITKGKIEFQNVYFSYAKNDNFVLKDVSFKINPGQKIAILGETGSGKTSLINLIPRFYEIDKGKILIDNIDLKNYAKDTLHSQISLALQESVIFSDTIANNISFGLSLSQKEIEKAAKIAQAHNFITKLPDKYQTKINQRGSNLSGGQKQRIAIARAIARSPKILIFDDSTSAIDLTTEAKIQDNLKKHIKDCTTIIIAQRISSVISTDKIIVLKDGKVVAYGNHEKLLRQNSFYQKIYQSQIGEGVEDAA